MNTRRTAGKVAAAATASSLVLLTGSPALAAEPVAQASATAIEVTVAGSGTDSGSYTVTNDGTGEKSSGTTSPAVSVLTGQNFLQVGTLAQQARTRIEGRTGASAACAGVAGDGAVLVEVGEGGCLTPGENLQLNAGNLDLSNVQLIRADFLGGLDQQLLDALAPVLDPLLAGLQTALQQVLTAADAAVVLDAGAIQSFCTARPGDVDGDTTLVGAGASLRLAGQEVELLNLPANPEPNTRLVTDLGQVVDLVLQALRVQFTEAIEGALGPLAGVIDGAAVLTEALETIGEQLAPLEENILEVTLNKQERSNNEITVTALDLEVLPVAEQFGVELLGAEIGRSSCGPNGRVQPDAPQGPNNPGPGPAPQEPQQPQVPTSVPAGSSDSGLGTGGLLAVLLTAVGAGAVATRRSLRA
ncbi:hypothetical protein [Nocardioides sp. SYSU DS0663]|uniref:hypothetical protein n=1 Tax=Nocardioides sp. SYSU DS0663 TaxID=3416445 RepID=UPI003F4BA7C6